MVNTYFEKCFYTVFIVFIFFIISLLINNSKADTATIVRPMIAENDLNGKSIITTDSGLQYLDVMQGSGAVPKKGDKIIINYVAKLSNGKIIDFSDEHGASFTFVLGVTNLVQGWTEGMSTMKVGGMRRIIIPPQLAYGSKGIAGIIPPNAVLVFDVQLISISNNQ